MLKPPPRPKMEYEKVRTDDWTTGIIEDIQHEENRMTGFKDKDTGEEIVKNCVRFKFKLDDCKFPHYSNWMTFGYGEKFNLYIKYISALVEGAVPDMDFDLEFLKGMAVKVMWKQNGEYQNVELVRPMNKKMTADGLPF